MVRSKSLATTGVPSEYVRPSRSVSLYVETVVADLGEVLGEARNQLRAGFARLMGVREKWCVHQPHRLPAVDGVGKRRVEEIGLRGLRQHRLSAGAA